MRRLIRLSVVLFVLGSGAVPVGAQELGLVAVGATSDNAEFPDPGGFGIFAQFREADWLFRLSYLRYADETVKSGTVCRVYSPRIGCRTEEVATSARMGGIRVTVQRALRLGEIFELGVGGGLSFNQLDADARGVAGVRADLHTPNAGQIGYLGSASLAIAPVPSVPVKLVAGVSRHWVDFRGCVSAEDRTSGYAPFCGRDGFTEVLVGFSVTVPRR